MAPPGLRESRVATPVGPPSKSIGQIERELDTARGRREFFSNRPDVSDDRALRRMKQADELQRFKNLYTKPVQGSSNLLQMKQGAPRSLAEESMRLANQYGPTFREIGSDIGYGIRSIGSALGERISQGRFGIMGIAKGLYEQFTNSAAKAKDALVKGVNKLSDIDLEVLKNKDQYKFLSKKPEIQEVDNLQKTQMTEFDKANLIRQNMEKISMPVTEKDNTVESAKVFDDSFRRLPATGMTQTSPTIDPFRRLPGSGYQAGAGMGIAAIDPGYEIVSDYKSPEVRMQELINQNQINNTNMFDLGINKANNQISELERVFGVDMQ